MILEDDQVGSNISKAGIGCCLRVDTSDPKSSGTTDEQLNDMNVKFQ